MAADAPEEEEVRFIEAQEERAAKLAKRRRAERMLVQGFWARLDGRPVSPEEWRERQKPR